MKTKRHLVCHAHACASTVLRADNARSVCFLRSWTQLCVSFCRCIFKCCVLTLWCVYARPVRVSACVQSVRKPGGGTQPDLYLSISSAWLLHLSLSHPWCSAHIWLLFWWLKRLKGLLIATVHPAVGHPVSDSWNLRKTTQLAHGVDAMSGWHHSERRLP